MISSEIKKCTLVLIVAVVLLQKPGVAQNKRTIDSLLNVLETSKGIDRYAPLFELTFEYLSSDLENALSAIDEARSQAFLSGDTLKIVKSSRIKAQILNKLDRTKESIPIFLSILSIARRHSFLTEESYILNSLANACLFQAKLDRALQYYLQSLETAQKMGDMDGISLAYRNIGLAYYKLQNYDKALVYYAASISIETNTEELSELPSLWLNMSLCYTLKRNFVEADKCISKAKSYCVKGCSREDFIGLSFCEGSIALGLKRLEVAKDHFLKSYALAIAEQDIRFQLDNIVCLTRICTQQNRLDEAERHLDNATALINESVALNLELIKVYALFVEFYGLKNNWQKQAEYQQRYIVLKDSIYNDRVTNSLMKIESTYLQRENTAKLAAQEQILTLNQEVISRQNLMNIFAGLFSLSLVTIAVLLVRSNRKSKIINKALDEKVLDRTRTLETRTSELLASFRERDLLIERTAGDLKTSIATIKGLCETGLKDIKDADARLYVKKVNDISSKLTDAVEKLNLPDIVQ